MKIGEVSKVLHSIKDLSLQNPKIVCISLNSILVEDKFKNKYIFSVK